MKQMAMDRPPTLFAQAKQIQHEIDNRFGAFLQQCVCQDVIERDEAERPLAHHVLAEAGRLGLIGYALPHEAGGEGHSVAEWGIALEQIGTICHDLSFTLLLGLFSATAEAIYQTGRADLIEQYVRPTVRGERFVSFAYTENADAFNFQSRVQKMGKDYLLNGKKVMITGGTIADAFLTVVRDEQDDLKVVLIERDDPGVSLTPVSVMGFRSIGLAALEFEDILLGPERIVVAHDGLSCAQKFLNQRRVILSCAPLGRMKGLLQSCVTHLGQTTRYGRPLSEMQSVQSKLGQMYMQVETSRTLVYEALGRLTRGETDPYWDPFVSMTKYTVADKAIQVAQAAIGLVGGAGYTKERPFERNLRDFYGLIPGAGSQNILEADLGQYIINQVEHADLLNQI